MSERDSSVSVLLVGHGTASEVGTRQFLLLAGQVADKLSPTIVEPAFLELQQPDIATGVGRLIERGAGQIVIAPLLLFAAGHAKNDIPSAVASALADHSSRLPVSQAAHLGCHAAMIELSRNRFRDAVAGQPVIPPDQTALVLVGRGSRDESATAEMHDFAQLRHEPLAASTTEVGFLAMARPSLAETLARVAAGGWKRVVIQPHLLFAGELSDTVQRMVAEMQQRHPSQQWLVTPLLADSQDSPVTGNQYLLQAVIERVEAAIRVVAPSRCD
jgi:sirohydrochlorin cobaltochelatase